MARKRTDLAIVPADAFTTLPWWDKLDHSEQVAIRNDTLGLSHALKQYGLSKLAIAEFLVRLQEKLEPRRVFTRHLKTFFPKLFRSPRTAYRWIDDYKKFRATLPEHVQAVYLARGFDMSPAYVAAIKKLPPPRKNDPPEKVHSWLDGLDGEAKTNRKRVMGRRTKRTPEQLLKTAYRFVDRCYHKLPGQKPLRDRWLTDLTEFLFNELGVAKPKTIKPAPPPEGFKAVRGRPRVKSDNPGPEKAVATATYGTVSALAAFAVSVCGGLGSLSANTFAI